MAAKSSWHGIRRKRVSRRRMLAAAGTGAAGLAALAAAGGRGVIAAPGDPPRVQGAPVRGGRYAVPITYDWGTLDPLVSVGGATTYFPRLYNALMARSTRQTDFLFFDLAEALEQPDEENYVFHIRSSVRIAPNDLGIPQRDMDAFDAKSWQDRVTADVNALLRGLTLHWLDSYGAPDAQTFTMRTRGPYTYFYFRIGDPLGSTIPPREFWERGISLLDQGVGAGPFVVRPGSFHESGSATLDRNVNYYRTDPRTGIQLPYVDGIDVLRITDALARRTAFMDRQIHEIGTASIAEVEEFQGWIDDLQVYEEPQDTFISFVMNPTRPPWDDERIRKAAMFALNRQEYVDRIVGGAGQPDGLVPWPLGDFALPPEELEQLQPYDPARSRQLIRDATGEDTIRVGMMYPAASSIQFHDQHLPIFLQQMHDAGFEIDQEPLDFTTWLSRYISVDYNASLSLNQVYETAETPLDWHSSQGPQGDGQFGIGIGALYPEVDEAIMDSKRVVDLDQQAEAVRDAQRLIYEKGPAFLPIMSWNAFVLRHPFVRDWYPGLGKAGLYLNDWWLDLPPPPTELLGDVDCDGRVDSADAAAVLQQHAGRTSWLPCQGNADVNDDGRVNSIDAALILQYEAGMIPSLPP